ncbi:MAG: NAD(P)H-hydrate dehydratase [bacterium]
MKVATARQMQALDRYTIEEIGLPGIVLMENAGRQVVAKMLQHFSDLPQRRVTIVCGKGNNGGDGLVVARHLSAMAADVRIFLLAEPESLSGDAKTNIRIIQKLNLALSTILTPEDLHNQQEALLDTDILVDALFGTGLTPPVRGLAAEVIELLNGAGKPIVSIDLPSGLSADLAYFSGPHIDASLTVTFALPKLAHVLPPACLSCGKLEIVDIGIPEVAVQKEKIQLDLIDAPSLQNCWPRRPLESHKGTYGHLLVLAGSLGKTGAAYLTSQSGARVGTGLVTLGIPESLNTIMEMKLTEVMTYPLPETDEKTFSASALTAIEGLLPRMSALAIGPGVGVHPEVKELVSWIIHKASIPVVLDADGINVLAAQSGILKEAKQPIVLTPHPKELSRLLGIDLQAIIGNRLEMSRRAAMELNCYVLLKGFRSLVADPEGNVFINPTGNPGMATGGTGDVLTGVIGGLLAQGVPKLQAVLAGVYLHGFSGDLVREHKGEYGLLAADLIEHLPMAIERLQKGLKKPMR